MLPRRSTEPKRTIDLDISSQLCDMSSDVIVPISILCYTIFTVAGGFVAPVLLRFCKLLPSDDLLPMLSCTLVDLGVIFIMTPFLDGEGTS